MELKDLQDNLVELAALLDGLDRVLPKRVDADLIDFVRRAQSDTWTAELLLSALTMAKQIDSTKQVKRSA